MCGIAGVWSSRAGSALESLAWQMVNAIKHRGPDAQDVWSDVPRGIALAHARLSIVDLSPAGAQPMASASGRFIAVYNGEIYNHLELRRELEKSGRAPTWRGHSDTETLLAAIDAWGLARALQSCTGMMALALWDRELQRLTLARDRFGEKPLYWAITDGGLVFGSELKALMQSGLLKRELSKDAAAALLRHNNIPAPLTVFEGVYKLMPGHWQEFTSPTTHSGAEAYWRATDAWSVGQRSPFEGTDGDAIAELDRLLSQAVGQQMVADVPLGAFLSGGIDSSTIVALMQSQSPQPVRTFSIGFHEEAFNEAEAARAVARHLGTQHSDLYVTPQDALDIIPKLPSMYCEPFADSSQVPTHLVARMARQQVTVALSGDGGDEVFGGYNRYLFGPQLQRSAARVPGFLRHAGAHVLGSLPPERWTALANTFAGLLPETWRFKDAGDKLAKVQRALGARSTDELYESFISQWRDPDKVVIGAREDCAAPDWAALGLSSLDFTEQMMLRDALGYLPNDILVKVDRAAMAVSLEGRIPFLDHRVYEFAARLPLKFKVRGGVTKWLVRQLLYRHVPQALIDRPKVGFGIPLDRWLRGELRGWAESLLSPAALAKVGMFDAAPVRKAWEDHQSGSKNLQHPLWCILMYQAWHQEWMQSGTQG